MVVTNACAPDPRVLRHARWLHELGCEVTVHAFDRSESHNMSELVDGVRIMRYHLGRIPYGGLWNSYQGIKRFQRVVIDTLRNQPPDVVYCHDADTLQVGRALHKQFHLPYVFDMHDLHHSWVRMSQPSSTLRKMVSIQLKRRMIQRCQHASLVITSSGQTNGGQVGFSEWLAQYGISSHVVQNRPYVDLHAKEEEERPWSIGYVGRIRDTSSFSLLLKAIELFPSHERPSLRIAGDGVAASRVRAMMMDAVESGLCEATVTGPFVQEDLPSILREVGVMYAMYNPERGNITQGALPVKMFDASAHGIPSVVNSNCLMGEIAIREELGIPATWNDAQSVYEAMCKARTMKVTLSRTAEDEQRIFNDCMNEFLAQLK